MGFGCSVTYEILRRQTAVCRGKGTEGGGWRAVPRWQRHTQQVPRKLDCLFLPAVSACDRNHLLQSLPLRLGTAAHQNKANTHTYRHSTTVHCNQALGPMVIGLSHSSRQQQVMAHSCLTTVMVKKKKMAP